MDVKRLAKRIWEEKENRRYRKNLARRRISYGEWAAVKEAGRKVGPLVPGRETDSDFVLFCAGEGRIASGAAESIGAYFAAHPKVQLLYGDEDVGGQTAAKGHVTDRRLPWYKPDWSPELLDSFFYFGSLVALRRELLERASVRPEDFSSRTDVSGRRELSGRGESDSRTEFERTKGAEPGAAGGIDFSKGDGTVPETAVYRVNDFSVYRETIRRLAELAGGYEKGACCVGHVESILFHGESQEGQEKFLEAAPHLEVWEEREPWPLLSIVIPTRDHPEVLERCLRSCLLGAEPPVGTELLDRTGTAPVGKPLPFEIILVDNGSTAENREGTERMLREMEEGELAGHSIQYLYRPMEFNFSKMCNLGAAQAQGELLLFLNDDVELCQAGTLGRMAAMAAKENVGAAGLKLYYPDSRRIQHAGITNLPMGPVHKLQFQEDDRIYYYGANRGNHNMLAVTAACLMVGREKYREAGGFPEDLQVAFNDVDFCFTLYEAGYRNVCMNGLSAYHHESLSRGDDESADRLDRLDRERELLYRRHPGLKGRDPYYGAGLGREGLDTGIRPAYQTAGNWTQAVSEPIKIVSLAYALAPGVSMPGEPITGILPGSARDSESWPEIEKMPWDRRISGEGYRRDACVLLRVEDCRGHRVLGYGVVLGDNNACYDRMLLLWEDRKPKAGARQAAGMIYALRLQDMYRPDLEENMPDQKNVALCGFDVEIDGEAVPAGRYRLGMAVRNRITGLGLQNWSNRFLTVREEDSVRPGGIGS